MKLFRHIRKLDADCILIDIGAGTHFHAMDAFLLADTPIAAKDFMNRLQRWEKQKSGRSSRRRFRLSFWKK